MPEDNITNYYKRKKNWYGKREKEKKKQMFRRLNS